MSQQTVNTNELTLNDLASLVKMIGLVSARGVFKAEELSSVGILHDKLANHIALAQKAREEAQKVAQSQLDAVPEVANEEVSN